MNIIKTKKKTRLILLSLLLLISLGYAILNSNMVINGTSKLNNSSWDIHFDNLVPDSNNVDLSTGDIAASINQLDTTKVTYTVTLKKPGDYYEFLVDVVNDGSIDGMVDTVSSTIKIGDENEALITNETLPSYLNYSATYEDYQQIERYQYLKAGEEETYRVRVEFKKDITNSQLPENDQTLVIKFEVNYIQASNQATEIIHRFSGTKYTVNLFDNNMETYQAGTNNSMVWIGKSISNNITQYDSAQEALAALKLASNNVDRNFYLKHIIQYDIVKESNIEFIITPELAEDYPGLVPGTYTIRGAGGTNCVYNSSTYNFDCDADSPYYQENVNTLKTAFGDDTTSYCDEKADDYNYQMIMCDIPELVVYAYRGGDAGVYDADSWYCDVNGDGTSECGGA